MDKDEWGHFRARFSLLETVEKYYNEHEPRLKKMAIHSIPQLTEYVYNKFMEENK